MKKWVVFIVLALAVAIGVYLGNLSKVSKTAVTSLAAPSSPHATTTPQPSLPKTLIINKIGINAQVENVGLDNQNRMDVPSNNIDVAWYNLGAKPGAIGNAVIDGHLDTKNGTPAVFWSLSKLVTGDEIQVIDNQNKTYNFKVSEVKTFPFDQLPLVQIFGAANTSNLNLITCEGIFNNTTHNYSNRVIV